MQRVKTPTLVITFPTTSAAMACEKTCQEGGLPGRMIPVPGEVRAGCGLAWKACPEDRVALESALSVAGVAVEAYSVIDMLEFVK